MDSSGPQRILADAFTGSSRVIVGVFLSLLLLFLVTVRITSAYRAERVELGASHYEQGRHAEAAGDTREAVEQYRAALTIARDRREYRQALAIALIAEGRLGEAETYLRQLLTTDPVSGVDNLMLARIRAKEGDREEAIRLYNRAIYGRWPDNSGENRIAARFELIDLLSSSGAVQPMQAELLQLLAEVPDDRKMKQRIAGLLLTAGAFEKAAEVYRDLLKGDDSADLYYGLGQAEFAVANYPGALDAYRHAMLRDPKDTRVARRLELAEEIVGLDPRIRRVSSSERFRRSRSLVTRVRASLQGCLPDPPSDQAKKLLASADQAAEARVRYQDRADAIESNITLAEELWKARETMCGTVDRSDQALSLLIADLSK